MKKVLFVGGDNRSIYAMDELKQRGFFVSSYGLHENDYNSISDFDVIVLPIPTTKDKKTVFCPISNRNILLSEIEEKAENRLIISCGYSFDGKRNVDVLSLDGYAFRNAVPTAEGAIAFAIDNTDFTLWKSKVLVIGNGRVAKVLISRLKNFGCDLTVSVFNTIDVSIFRNLDNLDKTLLIDLSSKGCLDFNIAKEKNIRAYKLPGLPGKVAPKTAGKILAETVIQTIKSQRCNN